MMTTIREVLSHYGTQIPTNVGENAMPYSSRSISPLVVLRAVEESRLSDEAVFVHEMPQDGDGVLVELDEPENRTYYTMQADVVTTFVTAVVTKTGYVIEDGDEEYLPSLSSTSLGSASNPVNEELRKIKRETRSSPTIYTGPLR